MDRVRAADRVDADLRQSDRADVARLHQLRNRADRVLDRDVRIEPRRAINVDVIDAEALERVREKIFDRGRTRIESEPR
jgi:hypothetical protein